MIACYRRISLLVSNNVRRLFVDTSKLSPKNQTKWPKKLLASVKTGRTATRNHDYQMLRIRPNVRLLLIANPDIEHKERVFCAFRVGAGAEEDPANMRGRAHLVEHTLCNMTFENEWSFFAITWPHYTVYSSHFKLDECHKGIKTWSELLFSESALKKIKTDFEQRVSQETFRIDNEFHEFRCKLQTNVDKLVEIVRVSGLNLANFRWGCDKAFEQMNDDDLAKEVNSFRKLYRRRPVNICIYSDKMLDMEAVLNSLNFNKFLETGSAEAVQPFHWTKRHTSHIDFSKHLVVLESDDDWVQFHILFPLEAPFNSKQSNTLDFICRMISLDTEGCLKHLLFDKYTFDKYILTKEIADLVGLFHRKWATKCGAHVDLNTFFITVNLTTRGLKNINNIEKTIQNYLTFLHDEWVQLHQFQYRALWNETLQNELFEGLDFQYALHIASHFDQENDQFDEADLFLKPSQADEQSLIKMQILDNKKKILAISTRDTKSALKLKELKIDRTTNTGTEPIFGAQYSICKTDLFTKESTLESFELKDLSALNTAEEKHIISTFITKPEDVVFQRLCETYVELEVRRFWTISGYGSFSPTPNGTYYNHPQRALPVEEFFDNFKPYKMTVEKFTICQQHLLKELAVELNDPLLLATSLMKTAVANVHNKIQMDPVPMQYNILKKMNNAHYKKHFTELHTKFLEVNSSYLRKEYNLGCGIKSINSNEGNTVTLLFCQTDDDPKTEDMNRLLNKHLNDFTAKATIYTMNCRIQKFRNARGLLLTVRSVELGGRHTSQYIIDSLNGIMQKELPKSILNGKKELEPLYRKLLKRTIFIQVEGSEKLQANDVKFEKQFAHWYEKIKPEMQKFYC